MKLFEFAIASIVDANTGHGLEGRNLSVDYSSAIHAGREIRAKSVLTLFASVKHQIGQAISNYRIRANNRRSINEISNLGDRLLKDIGLDSGDLGLIGSRQVTLEELDAKRIPGQVGSVQALQLPARVDKRVRKLGAVNQDSYAQARCA